MITLRCTLRGLAVLLCLVYAQSVYGQNSEAAFLSRRVAELHVEANNLHSALSYISSAFAAPIGLEDAAGAGQSIKLRFDMDNPTLRDALDAVTEQDKRYEWRLIGGAINVIPKTGRDNLLKDLLATKVRQFSIKEGTGRFTIRNRLMDIPEVKSKLEKANVTPIIWAFTNQDYGPAGQGFSLHMTDVTLREILNQIIKTSDTKYWVLSRQGDSGEKLIINF